MIIGVPREIFPGERRVAMVPAVVPIMTKAGFEVVVEAGAGVSAGFPDSEYTSRGARILPAREEVFRTAEIILQVLCHGSNDATGKEDLPLLRPNQVLVGFLRPLGSIQTIREIADRGVTSFSVELMPRTTRAQSMDALSSMATISGYKAVVVAADLLPRLFPMMTTAAGTITPARVLIIGAGVAGLQAIATARRLGAVVSAYDMRAASKEQINSLGGRFVELPIEAQDAQDARGYGKAKDDSFYNRQRELLGQVVSASDVVITAAVIPGKKSPVLVTREAVSRMAPGSVIIDMAAERGGNCEVTRPGELIVEYGVTVIGWFNLASTVPYHASQMYARNLSAFLVHLVKDGKLVLNRNDEIIRETMLTLGGEVVNTRVLEFFSAPAEPKEGAQVKLDLVTSLYVFMLAGFIGFEVIRRVSPLLHTPLMSLTNALDAIAVVGAIILAGSQHSTMATLLGTFAIMAATSNVVGGFVITDRMLKMFKSSGPRKH